MRVKGEAPVSVVIPSYNSKDTIERAVASVANQTWLPAEFIIVDDASSDGTIVVLHEMQKRYGDEWLKISVHTKNQGPGAARNTGWDIATQPYIAFLDADDAWHPRKIEIQLGYMLAHPEVAISGHRTCWLREGETPPPLPQHYTVRPISRWKMLVSNRLATRTVILKRDLGFRFEPAKRYSEDYHLWLRMICSGYKAVLIDLELAYIYKAPYGEGGLSAKLWEMEKGELDTYRRLYNEKLISWPILMGLSAFSLAKFMRRVVVSRLRK